MNEGLRLAFSTTGAASSSPSSSASLAAALHRRRISGPIAGLRDAAQARVGRSPNLRRPTSARSRGPPTRWAPPTLDARTEAERSSAAPRASRKAARRGRAAIVPGRFLAMLVHELASIRSGAISPPPACSSIRVRRRAARHAREIIGRQVDPFAHMTDYLLDAGPRDTGRSRCLASRSTWPPPSGNARYVQAPAPSACA